MNVDVKQEPKRPRGRPRKEATAPTDAVKLVRAKLGETQEQFAARLGVRLRTLQLCESERRLPSYRAAGETFGKLAKRAGVGLEKVTS